MNLWELARRLNKFDITKEVQESIVATAPDIVKLNRGQLYIGKRADGSYIAPAYKPLTVSLKELNPDPISSITDHVTLHDTGKWWEKIKVSVAKDVFTIDDTDSKTGKLVAKYGPLILGLSKESKTEEYIPLYFFPELKSRIESKTGLKLT